MVIKRGEKVELSVLPALAANVSRLIVSRLIALTGFSRDLIFFSSSGKEVDMTPPGQNAAMIALADIRAKA